jgi:outer membrane lipoprotein-sorting protein
VNVNPRAGSFALPTLALLTACFALATALSAITGGQSGDDLNTVIAAMNSKAAGFKNVSADIDWETHNAVMAKLGDKDEVQTGQSYLRRSGKDSNNVDFMLDIKEPTPKQLLYRGSKGIIQIYEPKINRITERAVGNNKSDADAYMSLGFGGRGDQLLKNYDVKWLGWETIDGVRAAKMELVGKTPGLQKAFSRAVIWIDPQNNVAVQQQFFQGDDYRIVRYHNPKVNGNVSDKDFKLHTTGSPEIVKM